jgi:hypothetical protein
VTPLVFAKQHAQPFTFASQGFIVAPAGRHICVMDGSSAVRNSVATASSMSSLLRLFTAASRPNFLRRCRYGAQQGYDMDSRQFSGRILSTKSTAANQLPLCCAHISKVLGYKPSIVGAAVYTCWLLRWQVVATTHPQTLPGMVETLLKSQGDLQPWQLQRYEFDLK